MKAKVIIALVAIAGMLGLVGCKPKETTLVGQVFIVTRGAENVKLGDVEILLIEKTQVTNFLQMKQPAIEAASFLESVPDVSVKLKAPNAKDEKFEDVVKQAQNAAVLVLVY